MPAIKRATKKGKEMSTVISFKVEPAVQHATSNSRPYRLDLIVIGNDGVETVVPCKHYTTIKGAEAAGKKRIQRNSIWL